MSLFETGIRPAVDVHLLKKSQEERDYGEYWSASSAGYCMRRVIFDRLKVPSVKEDARKQRVFEVGHVFHEWMQRITKEAGLSIAQELELQDEGLMVRGHIDDLVFVTMGTYGDGKDHLILYDYKTQNSRAFTWATKTGAGISHYHKMQLGTYMYMLRRVKKLWPATITEKGSVANELVKALSEARVLKISKDDLRMSEQQLLWSPELEKEVAQYWATLSGYWKNKTLPKCTCADYENGFAAREQYNPYFYEGKPCSVEWAKSKLDLTDWKLK